MKKKLYILMDLQLFATQTTGTNSSGNSLTAEMKTFYDDTLLDEAQPLLVHHQFGQKRPIPKGRGKVIEFRKFSSLAKATTPLTEGVTPSGNTLNVTAITATVLQYGDFVELSDLLELTAVDPIITETTKLCGNQAGLTMDTVVRNVLQAGTNVMYAPKYVTASGVTTKTAVTSRANLDATAILDVDLIKKAAAFLKAQNAKTIGGSYVGIIHPYAAYDLMSDPAWIDVHKYAAPDEIFNGEIGKIGGVRFVETSEAKIVTQAISSVNYGVFCTLILGADAYGVTDVSGEGLQTIIKQKGSAGTSDPLDQRSTVGWKALEVAEILNNAYMVRLESMSPTWSSGLAAN